MQDYSVVFKSIIAVSSVEASNLCNSSLCWDSKRTQKCKKCKNLYCQGHFVNHHCAKKFEGWF